MLWKVVRQIVRPAKGREVGGDGLRELPQTAMFGLAIAVGTIAGGGAWVFRQMIGLVHNAFFLQVALTLTLAPTLIGLVHNAFLL